MTSQGSAHGRFTRAIAQRNLLGAEMAARELRGLSLHDALDYVALVAELRPDRFDGVAVRWHGRLEVESIGLTLAESQLALAALGALRAGDREAVTILKRMLRRVRPTLVPPLG